MTRWSGARRFVTSSGYVVGSVQQIVGGGGWHAWFNSPRWKTYLGRHATAEQAERAVLDHLNGPA